MTQNEELLVEALEELLNGEVEVDDSFCGTVAEVLPRCRQQALIDKCKSAIRKARGQ